MMPVSTHKSFLMLKISECLELGLVNDNLGLQIYNLAIGLMDKIPLLKTESET
jgi:hypothetical protein